jgi:hypothetical protein
VSGEQAGHRGQGAGCAVTVGCEIGSGVAKHGEGFADGLEGGVQCLVLSGQFAEVHPAGPDSGGKLGKEQLVLVAVVHGELLAVVAEVCPDTR